MGAAVRARYTDADAFDAVRDSTFVQVAARYTDEVVRRANGAARHSVAADPAAPVGAPGSRQSVWTGTPRITRGPQVRTPRPFPLSALHALLVEPEDDDDADAAADADAEEWAGPLSDALLLGT
jgi:hypothetical protein